MSNDKKSNGVCPFCKSSRVMAIDNGINENPNEFVCLNCGSGLIKDISKVPTAEVKAALKEGILVLFNNNKSSICSIESDTRCQACEG